MRLEVADGTLRADQDSLPVTFSETLTCMAHLESDWLLNLTVVVHRPFRAEVAQYRTNI